MSDELKQLRQRTQVLEQENKELREELYIRNQTMDFASDGISIADATQPNLPLIYVNPAFEQITGYSRDEVIGKNCRFLQGSDTDQSVVDEIRAAIREQRDARVTLLNYRKDGVPFWNYFSIAPICDESGNVTHFIGIQVDVTDQKQAEIALSCSKNRLSSIITSAMDGIVTVDTEERITLFNAAAEKIFGYRSEDVLGQPLEMLIPEQFREQHHAYIQAFGNSGTATRHMSHQRVVSARHANGNEFPIEASISQVTDIDQKLYTVIVRDVTERVRAQQERDELQENIISMQHALVQELSTPLIPITDDVVIMPIVGSVDSLRAQNVMESLLKGVEQNRAHIAIMDITGVPIVDTQVANTLIQAAQAIRLLGAKVLLTGIGPDIAQTLVGLGVDLSGITTHSTLQTGITYAMRLLRHRRR